MNKLKIGLYGFGCVGQGLYHIINSNQDSHFEIVKIAVKDQSKVRSAPVSLFVYNNHEILQDPEIDIVVELIDDDLAAFKIVSTALRSGIPVVSANKKMLAERLPELLDLQTKHKTPLLYEGAVCGSIPILQIIKNYHAYDRIKGIEGIFNGSSNYILSKITNEDRSYDAALAEAQELGFAESDPTMDVEGFDAKYKLCLLAYNAFGVILNPQDVLNIGISKLTEANFSFAKKHALKIKLVAKLNRTSAGLKFIVAPTFIHQSERLYDIENEENAVMIDSKFAGKQLLTGKGAGSHPTGLAVFSDLQAIVNKNYTTEINELIDYSISNDEYLGYQEFDENEFRRELFLHIKEEQIGDGHNYIAGKISYESLRFAKEELKKSTILFSQKAYNQLLKRNTFCYA